MQSMDVKGFEILDCAVIRHWMPLGVRIGLNDSSVGNYSVAVDDTSCFSEHVKRTRAFDFSAKLIESRTGGPVWQPRQRPLALSRYEAIALLSDKPRWQPTMAHSRTRYCSICGADRSDRLH